MNEIIFNVFSFVCVQKEEESCSDFDCVLCSSLNARKRKLKATLL